MLPTETWLALRGTGRGEEPNSSPLLITADGKMGVVVQVCWGRLF